MIRDRLSASRISTSVFYPPAKAAWPNGVGRAEGALARAEAAAAEIISLPIYPRLRREQQERMVDIIQDVCMSRE